MDSTIIIFALATFVSTIIGGLLIIKFRKHLPYFFAFAAGTLIAVSFLDLIPESLSLAEGIDMPMRNVMLMIVFSFFLYSLVEKFFLTHHLEAHDKHGHIMGPIGAGSLVLHSFLDGVAIGTAFQVSYSVGLIIAFAVIFHGFTDGINTVTIMLKNKHHVKKAITFLIMAALAPALGILVGSSIMLSQNVLALILAFFSGEFIYIGASTLLPETREHKSKSIIIAMALGIIIIAILTAIVGV